MENQQPTGEAQNSQKKEWYKNWWGVIIAIVFLPIFLIWLIWAKTKWGKTMKVLATIVIAVIAISFMGSGNSDKNNQDKTSEVQKPSSASQTVQEAKKEAPTTPPAPQFVFDVPSLVGKNVDEVKKALGAPTTYREPTKQQLALSDIWDMEYTKNDTNLLVTYNPKTKVISDYFIDGTDKNKLLSLGNLKENNDAYTLEFVKSLTNPNEITGVKVSKKLPAELNANVTYSAIAFKIENKEDYNWINCKFELNGGGKIFSGGYEYLFKSGIKAKDSLVIPFSEFTKDSKRFNFIDEKPEDLFISCDTNGQHRTNYFAIN